MKKIMLLILLMSVVILSGCTAYHYDETDNGLWIGTSRFTDHAYAGQYQWDGTEEGKYYTVPDTFNGYTITTLGGSAVGRVPFSILLPSTYDVEGRTSTNGEIPEWFVQDYEIVEIIFYVELGVHIENIAVHGYDFIKVIDEANDFVFYYTAFLFTVVEANPFIYSNNGKLYDKETDELIPMAYPLLN